VGIPRITKEELKARLEADAGETRPILVDARLKYPYEHSTVTLPGAVRVSPQSPDWSVLPRDRDVVVYDSDPDEIVSAPLGAQLIKRGVAAVALKGGIADWMAANLPTEPKGMPQQTVPEATVKG
jgi:rhodanese-related sulfurtransferase